MWLFLLFVIVPIVEIGLFIQVGGAIGLWPTLLIVVLTALAGTILMRAQGVLTLQRLQTALAEGRNPTDPMAQGAMILVAGVLLLTPGFFTDALGFALLLPPVRVLIIRAVSNRLKTAGFTATTTQSRRPASDDTIDADYTVIEPSSKNGSSGWTKH